MNTEHENPKTQLPRAIEERPIVYDDEQLEEVREVATLPPIQLSLDEIEYAISPKFTDWRFPKDLSLGGKSALVNETKRLKNS